MLEGLQTRRFQDATTLSSLVASRQRTPPANSWDHVNRKLQRCVHECKLSQDEEGTLTHCLPQLATEIRLCTLTGQKNPPQNQRRRTGNSPRTPQPATNFLRPVPHQTGDVRGCCRERNDGLDIPMSPQPTTQASDRHEWACCAPRKGRRVKTRSARWIPCLDRLKQNHIFGLTTDTKRQHTKLIPTATYVNSSSQGHFDWPPFLKESLRQWISLTQRRRNIITEETQRAGTQQDLSRHRHRHHEAEEADLVQPHAQRFVVCRRWVNGKVGLLKVLKTLKNCSLWKPALGARFLLNTIRLMVPTHQTVSGMRARRSDKYRGAATKLPSSHYASYLCSHWSKNTVVKLRVKFFATVITSSKLFETT